MGITCGDDVTNTSVAFFTFRGGQRCRHSSGACTSVTAEVSTALLRKVAHPQRPPTTVRAEKTDDTPHADAPA